MEAIMQNTVGSLCQTCSKENNWPRGMDDLICVPAYKLDVGFSGLTNPSNLRCIKWKLPKFRGGVDGESNLLCHFPVAIQN